MLVILLSVLCLFFTFLVKRAKFKDNFKSTNYDKIHLDGIYKKGIAMKSQKIKTIAAFAALTVGMTGLAGCNAVHASGISAVPSSAATSQETTVESTSQATAKASQSQTEATQSQAENSFNMDVVNAKKKAVEGTAYALGTTYLGELANDAAMEVVLAQMGVDEALFKSNPEKLIDCGGTEIWFLVFNSDVTSVRVVMGDEEDGQELYKAENPGYIFIRCVSSGEIPACTVIVDGPKTGHTAYYPYMIEDQILLPNGGTVLNQSEGIEGYTDDNNNTNNSEETEEEEP